MCVINGIIAVDPAICNMRDCGGIVYSEYPSVTMVDFNQIQNAFIDALTIEDVENVIQKELLAAIPPGRDRVCAAVVNMISDWNKEWSGGEYNFDKTKIIQQVEESRALLARQEEDKELIDEARITSLLCDMTPEYKDGTYQRILNERELYLVTQMSEFLSRLGRAIPVIITEYISQLQTSSQSEKTGR